MSSKFRSRAVRSALAVVVFAAVAQASLRPACAQNDPSPDGGARLDFDAVEQIMPTSPVAGGNNPNASDDVLYIIEANEEEDAEILEDERGIIKQNGRPVGQKSKRRTHFFVNPSPRAAAKLVLSKRLSVEAFFTGGSGAFRESNVAFGTRATNISGGVNAVADLGLVNGAFGYEHRNAYASSFGPWRSTGDRVGTTFNKTLPFFIQHLTITPQLLTARDVVNPARSSSATVDATVGLTYEISPHFSVAASGGYSMIFLYGLPGYRHDNGLKVLVGANYKLTDQLLLTFGGTTNRTILYGLTRYRADGSLSPSASARYSLNKMLSINVVANYGRFLSNISGNSTFRFNINPGVSLTVPL